MNKKIYTEKEIDEIIKKGWDFIIEDVQGCFIEAWEQISKDSQLGVTSDYSVDIYIDTDNDYFDYHSLHVAKYDEDSSNKKLICYRYIEVDYRDTDYYNQYYDEALRTLISNECTEEEKERIEEMDNPFCNPEQLFPLCGFENYEEFVSSESEFANNYYDFEEEIDSFYEEFAYKYKDFLLEKLEEYNEDEE